MSASSIRQAGGCPAAARAGLVLPLALLLLASVTHAGPLAKSLDDYYHYYQAEDLANYYSVVDLSDMTPGAAAARKNITQTLWQKFDTLSYSISNATEYSEGEWGLAEYRLSATVRGPDGKGGMGEFSYSEPFVAFMHQVGGRWKVVRVTQGDVFYANMENYYLETQNGTMDAINSAALEKIRTPDALNGSAGGGGACQDDLSCGSGWACVGGQCQKRAVPPAPCLIPGLFAMAVGLAAAGMRKKEENGD